MRNKGITLIALVVTIIILLILAGVTVGIATSGSGIFEKAKESRDKWQNAQNYEETEIAKITNEIDSYVGGGRENMTIVPLYENLSSTSNATITLSESYKNFKSLIFCYSNGSSTDWSATAIFPVAYLKTIEETTPNFTMFYASIAINVTINSDLSFSATNNPTNGNKIIKAIYGVK